MEGVVLYVALVRVFVKKQKYYIAAFTIVSYGMCSIILQPSPLSATVYVEFQTDGIFIRTRSWALLSAHKNIYSPFGACLRF